MKATSTSSKSEALHQKALLQISFLLFSFFLLFNTNTVAQVCCPDFILKDAVEICPVEGACVDSSAIGGQSDKGNLAACKESAHVYTVYPNDAAYSYTWTVSGGSPASFSGNPNVIVWGSGNVGFIKVVISNLATGGTCIDSITTQICLMDGPEANFIVDQDTVCENTGVHFTNLSLGGSEYLWDFGDGTTSTLANPTDHAYTSPGIYTVTLTATDMGAGRWVFAQGEPPIEMLIPCGCSDTITRTIVVLPGEGPKIETDCCYGTVCPGETSSFCTPPGCPDYDWTVTGGTIISGAGTPCVEVQWFATYVEPTTISLETPGCGSAPCDGMTTLYVPVLYPNLPISGPITLCQGASGSFSLPTLPGTYYTWGVSGGSYQFNLEDRNTPTVNITFNDAASYTVKCDYDNPLSGCSGSSTFLVNVLPEFSIYYGEETVCEGEVKTYFASGDANWSVTPTGSTVSGAGASANISWNTPGNYTITATPVNPSLFCNAIAVKTVEVIAKPILDNISSADSICPGSNYTYQISSDTEDNKFVWAISGGTGTIHSEMGNNHDSVVVQWTGVGPWQLSVYQEIEISPGIYCASFTEVLDVFPFMQPVVSGPNTVCVDASEVYTAGGSNPSGEFEWSIIPASQGTIQSGQGTNSVTVLWHGPSATATLIVTSCVGSDSQTISITGPPNAVATYSSLPIFCLGDAVSLTLASPFVGTYSYQWYKDGLPIPSATSNTLAINVALFGSVGTYKYQVEVTDNGCTVISNIIDVVIKNCEPGTPGGPPLPGSGCDAVAYFWSYVECDQVTLLDQSYTVGTTFINLWNWSVTGGGTFDNSTAQNPILSVPVSGPYTITLVVTSSSGCTSTYIQTVNILLPNADFNYSAPICDNAPAQFDAIPVDPNLNYAWDFGDGYTSYEAITEHTYGPPSPTTYNVTLVITDEKGCIATVTKTITINPSPVCSISASDTIFCPGSFETLTACSGMGSYQWYKNGNPITGANSSTYDVYEQGEYSVVVSNSTACTSESNEIYMYMNSLPIAQVTGEGHICAYPSTTSGIYLTANYDSDYSYSWSSNPPGASFSPTNSYASWASVNLPAVLPATYEFIVHVTDNTTGCVNSDTMCATFYETPTLSVPYLNSCEGNPVTLTPTPNDPVKYSYQWSNGATTPTIVASAPGYYTLTMTDKANGCSAYAEAGFIFEKPDLSLFPLGCADICTPDTLNLYIPLPLNALWPNNTYPSAYPSITWYDNGDYTLPIGYGENLSLPAANTGSHQISVIVQNKFGCVDTAGVFCLTDDVCCEIIVDYIHTVDASCAQSSDGTFNMMLNAASIGAPFTITQIFPTPVQSWPITPGVPFSLTGLPPGSYAFEISSANGDCKETFDAYVGFLQDDCCFAAIDSNFIHINSPITYTSETVWDNKYYIADGVIVTVDGTMLDITNVDVVFGECAGIEFINGAYLRANNSVFRPCDIDKSWKGLRFDTSGEFDNMVNESTFKNAEVALYFQNGADAVVSNNLFSNCNFGVRVENNTRFNHPISGNRFVTEDFFPDFACTSKYPFVNNNSTYGVYSTSSRFLNQISHNEFINSKGVNYPSTFGIYQIKGGGVLSENTFTDIGTSIYLYSQLFYSSIENNEIEVNIQPSGNFTSIYVIACQGPVVEIMNNELNNNYEHYVSFSAIYTYSSTNINITGNEISGFNYGIIDVSSVNHQVTNNTIENCLSYGIYTYELPNSTGFFTCNSIKMRSFSSSIGFVGYNMSQQSEVSSNCITDCYTSMTFYGWTWGGSTMVLPLIRNNYLYNYNYVGINVQGYSGNIGTASDPGLNTLWSNNNSAIDINSSSSITAADNFGMFNISFPQVSITSNNPYHSTASCGHQIFNMPSQGNLNIAYDCDNSERLLDPLMGSGGNYALSPGYMERFKNSNHQFDFASLILASIHDVDVALLDELISNSSLSANEEALLKFDYFYRNGDFTSARTHLDSYSPSNANEINFKALSAYDLDIKENGWDVLSGSEIEHLKRMASDGSINANFAVSLLNNVDGFRPHIVDEPEAQHVLGTGNIKRIESEAGFLNIFPNPVKDVAYIELHNSLSSESNIEIYDLNGRLYHEFSINFVAGGVELDIRQLKAGVYFITLTNPESGVVQKGKMVKMKND